MAKDSPKIMFMDRHPNKTFLKITIAFFKVGLVKIRYSSFLILITDYYWFVIKSSIKPTKFCLGRVFKKNNNNNFY